jgi:hypothetical protein
VPIGSTTLIIDRNVTGIARRQVSEDLLAVPKGYRDLTPKPEPAAAPT